MSNKNEILAEPGPESSCAEDEDKSDDEEDWDVEIQDGDCDDNDSAEGSIFGMEGVDQEQREEAENLAEDSESFQQFHKGSL